MKTIRIAENIKFYRNICKMSQTELAENLKLKDRTNISNYENGTNFPTLERTIKLSEIFGITLDELVFENNNENDFLKDIGTKDIKDFTAIFSLIFTPAYSTKAATDQKFMKAYGRYCDYLNNVKQVKDNQRKLTAIYDLFLDSWASNQTIESAANLIKILFSCILFTPY